jgi:hypothetical protein
VTVPLQGVVYQKKKKKKKQLVKPGGTAGNVAYHCTLEDVTTDITPKNHIRLLSKGMLQVSDFFYN